MAREEKRILSVGLSRPPVRNAVWIPSLRVEYVRGITRILLAGRFDAIVFTSPRGVKALYWDSGLEKARDRVRELLGSVLVGAVGRPTRREISRLFNVNEQNILVPPEETTGALARLLLDYRPRSVVGLRADKVTPDLERTLRSMGVQYEHIVAYRVYPDKENMRRACELYASNKAIVLVATSGLIVREFLSACRAAGYSGLDRIVPFGPVTARTMVSHGVKPLCIPSRPSWDAVEDCIKRAF